MMKILPGILFFVLLNLSLSAQPAAIRVSNLFCANQKNPLGIETKTPSLSWQMTSSVRSEKQIAYQIVVAESVEELNGAKTLLWDSGKQLSDQSLHIPYAGKTLVSGKKYYWKVRVWDTSGKISQWSDPAFWQMGLLSKADWKNAKWLALTPWADSMEIFPGLHVPHNDPNFGKKNSGTHDLPMFRKSINVRKPLKHATAFISGVGHYEFSVNGNQAGKDFLAPGWTNYRDYIYYNTVDISGNLEQGKNAVGVMLGNGFYNVPNSRYRKLLVAYGNPKMICKIVLEYKDGTREEIVSDENWKAAKSPVTYTSIYGGEDYDATREQKGWNTPDFNDTGWQKPVIVNKAEKLLAQISYPMAVMDTFSTVKITQPKPGIWVYDMGQNASAIPQITIRGNRNGQVTIRPAELIHDNGLTNQTASGDPHFYVYTLKGEGTEVWQPKFTYYGFRYIQIEGAVPEGEPNPDMLPVVIGLRSLHVRNAAPSAGSFTSSNALFNQIYTLINWAIKSNITHVVTDCPHREKLGWLEETYLMGNSIRLNFDMALLNKKMFSDMKSAQLQNGLIPDIAPEYVPFDGPFRDSPEWGSAGIILPWYSYQWYGDQTLLSDQYEMMTRYAAYLDSKATDHILMHGLGDWFDMGPGPMGESQLTPKGLTPTATYYHNITILAKIARILGKTDDAQQYESQAIEIKKAFNRKFYNKDTHQYATGSQTANAIALYTGLTEHAEKETVYQNLIKGLADNNYVLTAGDIGFHYLVKVLSEGGATDVLYKMNNRNDVPGYGYQLAHGATALTESWPALRNVSNNHLMLGHLMEWFYEGIGGIRQQEESVAYRQIVIQPQFPTDMAYAKTSYESPYGQISTDWKRNGNQIEMEVTIPVNATATLILPVKDSSSVKESGETLPGRGGITSIGNEVKIGSGKYSFQFSLN